MPNRRSLPNALLALSLLTLGATAPIARADSADALRARLHQAASESALDDPQLNPWHLKLAFQLLDAKGAQTEAGTIEEWWSSPSLFKIVYTSPSYNSTEIRNADGFFRTTGAAPPPEALESILEQAVHPMPDAKEIEQQRPDLHKQSFGKITLDCIMLDPRIQGPASPPLGLFPTYCFDPGQTSLRVTFNYGSTQVLRNRIGRFQEKTVALDQTRHASDLGSYHAEISALQTFTPPDGLFAAITDMQKGPNTPMKIGAGVMEGMVEHKVAPVYPEQAKINHISGTVVLSAVIGIDGRISSLHPISTPDAGLATAAIDAVRQWRYKPYLLNGQPVEIHTTIAVHFNFGF